MTDPTSPAPSTSSVSAEAQPDQQESALARLRVIADDADGTDPDDTWAPFTQGHAKAILARLDATERALDANRAETVALRAERDALRARLPRFLWGDEVYVRTNPPHWQARCITQIERTADGNFFYWLEWHADSYPEYDLSVSPWLPAAPTPRADGGGGRRERQRHSDAATEPGPMVGRDVRSTA